MCFHFSIGASWWGRGSSLPVHSNEPDDPTWVKLLCYYDYVLRLMSVVKWWKSYHLWVTWCSKSMANLSRTCHVPRTSQCTVIDWHLLWCLQYERVDHSANTNLHVKRHHNRRYCPLHTATIAKRYGEAAATQTVSCLSQKKSVLLWLIFSHTGLVSFEIGAADIRVYFHYLAPCSLHL